MLSPINIISQLPIHPINRYERRPLSFISYIVIHHTASDYHTTNIEDIQAAARYHVTEKGWPGIGYHYFITKSGLLFQTNWLSTVSYHIAKQNTPSVGIVFHGDYSNKEPLEAPMKTAKELIHYLRKMLPFSEMYGHKEIAHPSSPTICPGNDWEQWAPNLGD